jgi:hypothetical protein
MRGYGEPAVPATPATPATPAPTAEQIAKAAASSGGGMGLVGGVMMGFKAIWDVRQQERADLMQAQLNTYGQSRQDIIQAKLEQRALDMEAEKSRYMPVYLTAGLVAFGILAITMKQVIKS